MNSFNKQRTLAMMTGFEFQQPRPKLAARFPEHTQTQGILRMF
jgi:hypothetical protein